MQIYIAMDDTDSLKSRGTGRLARAAAEEVAKELNVSGVTRHQLYVHEDIPFTSHNSCAVLHIDGEDVSDKKWIFETVKEVMLNDFIEGSDPGVAVACADEITAPLIAFGRDAQKEVMTQNNARKLAKNLGIRLEGLGGTEDGVIGTMAGLGLAKGGNDGRFIQTGNIREICGPSDIATLIDAGVDLVYTTDGRIVENGRVIIEEGKSVKPCPVDGKAVLFVEEIDGAFYSVKRG